MCQSYQHFAEVEYVRLLDQEYARIHFYAQYCIEELSVLNGSFGRLSSL